jgi:hypothetical protein
MLRVCIPCFTKTGEPLQNVPIVRQGFVKLRVTLVSLSGKGA